MSLAIVDNVNSLCVNTDEYNLNINKMLFTILSYIVAILIFISGSILIYYNYAFSYWKSRGMPYLPPTFPFGNVSSNVTKYTGQIFADLYHQLKQNGFQYGGVYLLTSPFCIIISPEISKLVLMKNYSQFQDHGLYIDLEKDKMAANLLTQSGNDWKQMRMKLAPAFTPARIKMMFPLLIKCTNGFDEFLCDIVDKSEGFDIFEFAGRYFTDVISNCAFGIECNCVQNPNAEFRRYGKMALGYNFVDLLRLRLVMSAPWICKMFHINMFNPQATGFFHKVVLETIAYREQNNIQRPDLLDNLMQLRKKNNTGDNDTDGLTDTEVAAQLFLFYLAGFETSSSLSSYCMCELANDQDIQNKVRSEVMQVLKEGGGVLTYEGIMKMKYLDKVLSETLRKNPSVLMVDRMCTESFQIPDSNIKIEKGTRTIISVLGLHRDPEYYSNPEKFDPERFNEEEISKRPAYSYLPFGEGPRYCPGAKFGMIQAKVFITTMLKNYRYSLHPSVKMPIRTYSVGSLSHPLDTLTLFVEKLS